MLPAKDRHHWSVAKWVTFNIVQHILGSRSIRLVYLSNSHQLIAMAPYTIHEAPIHHFSKRIDKMLSKLSLDDDDDVTMELHTNLAIEDDAVNNLIIPDFHLNLCSRCNSRSPSVPLWLERLDLAQVCCWWSTSWFLWLGWPLSWILPSWYQSGRRHTVFHPPTILFVPAQFSCTQPLNNSSLQMPPH